MASVMSRPLADASCLHFRASDTCSESQWRSIACLYTVCEWFILSRVSKLLTFHSEVQSERKTTASFWGKRQVNTSALTGMNWSKIYKISNEHSRSRDRDMKPEPPEYKAGALSISPWHTAPCCYETYSKEMWQWLICIVSPTLAYPQCIVNGYKYNNISQRAYLNRSLCIKPLPRKQIAKHSSSILSLLIQS
jgi:hypothetical protein